MKKLKIVTRAGCKGYYIRPTEFGKAVWKFLSYNKSEAERMAKDNQLQRAQKRKDGYVQGADFKMVVRSYLRSKFDTDLTTRESKRRYQGIIKMFQEFAEIKKVSNISDINTGMIEEYLYSRTERGIARRTWNMERMVISNLFRYAIARKWTNNNPTVATSPKKVATPHVENLTEEEAILLLKKMKEKDYKVPYFEIVATILFTGMRVNEVLHLTKDDVDLARSLLYIRGKEVDGKEWHPKNKENRYAPIADEIKNIIEDQMLTEGELLFQTTKGHVINNRRVLEKVKECCQEARIKEVHVHSLRHTFCSIAHMRDIPETAIQEVLGHKSASMTRRYRHLRPDYLHERFKAFSYEKEKKEE
ncbi:MAG: tyrosine-type recombinase/integrase [Candidatus Omnitrophota bacterium]